MQDKPAGSTGIGGGFVRLQLAETGQLRRQPELPILERHCVVQYVTNMGDESVMSNRARFRTPTMSVWRMERFIGPPGRLSAEIGGLSADTGHFSKFYFGISSSVKKD